MLFVALLLYQHVNRNQRKKREKGKKGNAFVSTKHVYDHVYVYNVCMYCVFFFPSIGFYVTKWPDFLTLQPLTTKLLLFLL